MPCLNDNNEFCWEQSTLQWYIFPKEVLVGNQPIDIGDLILMYKSDGTLVGGDDWRGMWTDIPLMIADGTNDVIDGYLNIGDVPNIKVYKQSTNLLYDVINIIDYDYGDSSSHHISEGAIANSSTLVERLEAKEEGYELEVSAPILGDYNEDNVVDVQDALAIIDALLTEETIIYPDNPLWRDNADIDGNGQINIADAMQIIQIILNDASVQSSEWSPLQKELTRTFNAMTVINNLNLTKSTTKQSLPPISKKPLTKLSKNDYIFRNRELTVNELNGDFYSDAFKWVLKGSPENEKPIDILCKDRLYVRLDDYDGDGIITMRDLDLLLNTINPTKFINSCKNYDYGKIKNVDNDIHFLYNIVESVLNNNFMYHNNYEDNFCCLDYNMDNKIDVEDVINIIHRIMVDKEIE